MNNNHPTHWLKKIDRQLRFSFFRKERVHYFCLLALSAFIIFFRLGNGSLWDWDEAIYASVAKAMLHGGDWLSLHMNGAYWPEKPPLIIWLMAASFRLLGINEWAARLPSAVFGWLSVLLTYHAGKRLFNHWVGLWGALFLLANVHFLILARMAMLDVPFLFFVSLALYFIWLGSCKRSVYYYWAGLSTGLAVMTKGAVGLMPIPISMLYFLISARAGRLKQPAYWGMTAISILIAAPWPIYQWRLHGRAFSDYYFGYNLFTRMLTGIEKNTGTVFFYAKYVMEHFFSPWLILAALVLLFFGKDLAKKYAAHKTDPIYFFLIWFFSIALFFSLAATKVAGYIAPAYFPLALMTAALVHRYRQHKSIKILFSIFALITVAHLLLLHPMKLITIDKSPGVKALARHMPGSADRLWVYKVPVNAPIFYFNTPVTLLDQPQQWRVLLSNQNQNILLCRRQDVTGIEEDLGDSLKTKAITDSTVPDMVLLKLTGKRSSK